MSVPEYHTERTGPHYRPRGRLATHNQSDCGYGQLVTREGTAIAGRGTDPFCDKGACTNV